MTSSIVRAALTGLAFSIAASLALPGHAQTTANGEWPSYGGDLAHTRYAPFDQINAGNFGSLEIAWRFSTTNLGPAPEYRFQSTPVMVDGVLYTTGGSRRAVTALDATTGKQIASIPIGKGIDGMVHDAQRHRIVTSNGGDSSLTVIQQDGRGNYSIRCCPNWSCQKSMIRMSGAAGTTPFTMTKRNTSSVS